ncbi:glycosyltransferase [Thermochromatium tepidum]|uniref:Glycosyltransferase n=1 Tax=Thermochromatium tepidum ATCC 43061 TaxID=316276 RepID=A0A6I6E1P7_THETI|nr:glycosyltransferase [Thermochromatium tepidum]QGU33814.1 glycosyltransferase [Thermochromatium tepidum ATCC 43061]
MRVLHLGKYFPPFAGGMEHFLADLLPALAAHGVESSALVHHERPGWRGALPTTPEDPPVYRAPTYGRLLYAPLSPTFPWWLARLIGEWRPDLLHLHLPNTSAFWALALPRARRLPWVVHWHSDVVASTLDRRLKLAYGLYRPWEQALLARAARIIVTSPDYLDASQALAPWRARCVVIPLGLDPARLPDPDPESRARAEQLWGANQGLRILAIGRLTYYKGYEILIQAAAQRPETHVLIVGAGELAGSLHALIRSLGLEGRVQLLGQQPDPLVHALIDGCDLLCLPSIERTEAFGLVQLEAMRFGKPVVVSDIPGSGTGWVVRQAGHGLMVPPGDPKALAAAIEQLGQDPAQARRLGQAGAQALETHFGIARVAEQIARGYVEVLDARPQSVSKKKT